MTVVETQPYPELRQLFGAYLNADVAREYGSVAAALEAYRRETGPAHRTAALAELDRLTAAPGAAIRLHEEFAALGCEVHLANAGAAWGLAATIRRSITPDALISFIDGQPYRMLKRHLTTHGLTPQRYRQRYSLPADYPMTAPNYSAARSELAKALGLGRKAPPPPAPLALAEDTLPEAPRD